MTKHTPTYTGETIGVDLGDRYTHVCVLDATGEIVERTQVATRIEALRQWFARRPASRVALEVGTHSPWASRVITDCGHRTLVANPRKVRLVYATDSKSDRVDAECLARLARVDPKLLSPVHHRSPEVQADLAILRTRDVLVRTRSLLINHVRGTVKPFGGRIRSCEASSFAKKAVEDIPEVLRAVLDPVLRSIRDCTDRIREFDHHVEAMCTRYPVSECLMQIAGVGPITTMTYILTIEDPRRFRRSRAVGSYLGLRPRRDQSGSRDPQLRITKAGDGMLRRLLVQSAHYVLGPFGPDSDLRRKGMALAARGGKAAKKRAVVAIARRLAVLLHRLWLTGEVYEPLYLANRMEATLTQS